MKLFGRKEIRDARAHSLAGGQALHVYQAMPKAYPEAPRCFKRSKMWGHLLDQDEERLVKTAMRMGVVNVMVSERGQPGQHVDLCGRPLLKAMEEARRSDD